MDMLIELFSHSFIRDAVFVGMLVSLCAALLGVSLVLKRYSMIGDGLSHVGFGALALAMALSLQPMQVAIPIVVIAAFFLLRISESSQVKGDAAIAIISSSALAIGVIITALSGGMNTDISSYMFGTILAMSGAEVTLSIILSIVVLVLFIFFYHRIFAITFDEEFSQATGLKVGRYNMLIAILTALTIVVGMRIMGTLMISSLIIFPALSAMRVLGGFRQIVICSALLSLVNFIGGILLSFLFDLPVGASVVMANLAVFLICAIVGVIWKR